MTATLSRGRDHARSVYKIERLSDPKRSATYCCPIAPTPPTPSRSWSPRSSAWRSGTPPPVLKATRCSCIRAAVSAARYSPSGDPAALEAALSLHPGPRFSFGSLRPEHRSAVQKYFVFTQAADDAADVGLAPKRSAPAESRAVRLTGRDISQINRLYAAESGSSSYQPRHIDDGVYYGVFIDNFLVSIAGTHVVSYAEGVAVVGNVFTHPMYRGGGLATIATGADDGRPAGALPARGPHRRERERAGRARLPAPRLRDAVHAARNAADPQGAGRRRSASCGASSPRAAAAAKARRSSYDDRDSSHCCGTVIPSSQGGAERYRGGGEESLRLPSSDKKRPGMTSRQYDAIDERVATEIKRLHKEHPKLGHEGLLEALGSRDIDVDPEELEHFMKRNALGLSGIGQPWKWSGLPRWWPGMGRNRPSRSDTQMEVEAQMTKTIGIVLFPDFEDLDAIGPREALTMMAKGSGGEWEVVLVSEDGGPVQSSSALAISSTTATRTARRST